MSMVLFEQARLDLCYDSLHGLSVGDALGAQFFMVGRSLPDLEAGRPPEGRWEWTDDTEMACSVVTELRDHGAVDPDRLAVTFARRCEPYRGYGAGAVVILHQIRDGRPWRRAAAEAFGGQRSCGNGAAMRVAPLGAYHADHPRRRPEPSEPRVGPAARRPPPIDRNDQHSPSRSVASTSRHERFPRSTLSVRVDSLRRRDRLLRG